MAGVWVLARVGVRRRARSIVLLALIIGLAGGATLTAFAGARRTNTAVDRFVAYSRPGEVFVGAQDTRVYDAIARLPEVTATQRGAFMGLAPLDRHGRYERLLQLNTEDVVSNIHFSRPLILAGHLPSANDPTAVIINPSAAVDAHVGVGDSLRFQAFAPSQIRQILRGAANLLPAGPRMTVHVAAIARSPADLSVAPQAPDVNYQGQDNVIFTPAFYAKYGTRVATAGGVGLSVHLRHGAADLPQLRADVHRLSHGRAFVGTGSDDLTAASLAKHATRLASIALLIFAILAALLTFTMAGQALARQVQSDVAEAPTLRAIGVTRRQLVGSIVPRALIVAVGGAALACLTAWLASASMPIGVAREAEVHPGRSVDSFVFGVGGVAIVVGLTAWSVLTAARATTRLSSRWPTAEAAERSRLAERVSGLGLPPTAGIGVRMALQSDRAVPVRTTIIGAVVAVIGVTATLCFGSNLTRLATHPRLQGWNWDVSVGNPHSDDVRVEATRKLDANPMVAGFTSIAGPLDLRSPDLRGPGGLVSLGQVRGDVYPPMTAGHAPVGPDEVALGALTLRDAHKHVGDRITLSSDGPQRSFTISGRIVLSPTVVNDQVPLGQGVVVTPAGLHRLGADNPNNAPVNVFLVRFKPGVDRAAALRRMRQDFPGTVLPAVAPPDIENLRRVGGLPGVLAGLFALVALLTVGHTLVSSVRRRRRELAVLRTMGFLRRQVSAAVAWQATTVALIAVVIGVPLGIVAGRWSWALVTRQLGLPDDVAVPVLIALVVPAVVLALNAVAALPGVLAGRTNAAAVLRSE